MAIPLHVRVREWFADASGSQLPHIRAVPRGQRRRSVLTWETPMPGHTRAGLAAASLAIAVVSLGVMAILAFSAYVVIATILQ